MGHGAEVKSKKQTSVGQGAACPQTRTNARAEVRDKRKEHIIPWRIKFLSCCIVDILTDDVTRLFGGGGCRLKRFGSVANRGGHTHTQRPLQWEEMGKLCLLDRPDPNSCNARPTARCSAQGMISRCFATVRVA